MEDNLKTTSNEDLRTLQSYLDDRVEDEHRFKLALQRKLDQNIGKKPKHHHYHGQKTLKTMNNFISTQSRGASL